MIRTLHAFLEFCYLIRRDAHDTNTLQDLDNALNRFHKHREVFVQTGVRKANSWLPRQHSLKHYIRQIRSFGSPNGLCSLITKSKHIEAVKKPWRRSNCYNTLKQMLVINSRSDKLRSTYNTFKSRGMLNDPSDVSELIEGSVFYLSVEQLLILCIVVTSFLISKQRSRQQWRQWREPR